MAKYQVLNFIAYQQEISEVEFNEENIKLSLSFRTWLLEWLP